MLQFRDPSYTYSWQIIMDPIPSYHSRPSLPHSSPDNQYFLIPSPQDPRIPLRPQPPSPTIPPLPPVPVNIPRLHDLRPLGEPQLIFHAFARPIRPQRRSAQSPRIPRRRRGTALSSSRHVGGRIPGPMTMATNEIAYDHPPLPRRAVLEPDNQHSMPLQAFPPAG